MDSFDDFDEFLKTNPKYAFIWDKPSMDAKYGQTCDLFGIDISLKTYYWTLYMKKDYEYSEQGCCGSLPDPCDPTRDLTRTKQT